MPYVDDLVADPMRIGVSLDSVSFLDSTGGADMNYCRLIPGLDNECAAWHKAIIGVLEEGYKRRISGLEINHVEECARGVKLLVYAFFGDITRDQSEITVAAEFTITLNPGQFMTYETERVSVPSSPTSDVKDSVP